MADDHFRMVDRAARPGRTAVLMLAPATGWESVAAGVLGSLSVTWGGSGDIIVPVTNAGPDPAFQPAVRALDPDWVGAYRTRNADMPEDNDDCMWIRDVPVEDVATVSGWCSPYPGRNGFHPIAGRGQPFLGGLVDLSVFPDAWKPEAADLDLSQIDPVLALMVMMRTGTLRDAGLPDDRKPRLLTAMADDTAPLAELALTGAAETRMPAAGSEIRHLKGLGAQPADPAVSPLQPLQRTRYGMERLRDVRARPKPWVVVVGDTVADFCFALACDRLISGATWLPLGRLPGEILDMAFPALALHVRAASTMNATPVPFTSVSLDTAGIQDARNTLVSRGGQAFTDAHTEVISCGALQFAYPARLGDPAHLALAESSAVHRDAADESLHVDSALQTPVPEVARTATGDVTWEVDVHVEGEQPPARSALGKQDLLVTVVETEDLQIRAGTEALSYHSRSALFTFAGSTLEMSLARPRLRLPAASDVLARLADTAGYETRSSQTGRLNATLVGLWGGIAPAAADLGGQAWLLLHGLTPVPGEKDGPKNGRLIVQGQPYVTFDQAAALLGLTAAGTREILDRLSRRRILRRGLVLCCARCNWLAWYSLEDLGQDFRCTRCTHLNMIEQQLWRNPLEEPAWYYDLDHAVREALKQNGHVPILAADRLAVRYRRAFSLAFDFEMIRTGADRPTVEVDLGAIGDGQVILCEAKSCDTLATSAQNERRDVGKLMTACRALTADVLCLATSQPAWSQRTRAAVQAECDLNGVRVLWLEGLGLAPTVTEQATSPV